MNAANHSRLGDLVMTGRAVFDLNRGDPFTARLNNVFGSVGNRYESLGTDRGHVAGFEPTRFGMGIGAFKLVVARANPGASYLQRAKGLAIPRQFLVIVIGDFHLDTPNWRADICPQLLKFLGAIKFAMGT